MVSTLKQILSYYPLRYYAVALAIAFLFIQGVDTIGTIEEQILNRVLNFFQIHSFIANGNLFVGEASDSAKITLPIFLQILFLVFFPTLMLTARTNPRRRLKILSFGLICFLSFIGIEILLIGVFFGVGFAHMELIPHPSSVKDALWALRQTSTTVTIIAGALAIHFALFTTITIPPRTKIIPVLRKRRGQEYLYLATVIIISAGILSVIAQFLYFDFDIDSPVMDYVHIYLWLNLSSIINLSYWVANAIHEAAPPSWIRKAKRHKSSSKDHNFSISFLIPAYNEQVIIGRCIDSIDQAAKNYAGKVEIILVNDGSIDNTEKIAAAHIANLKHASGTLYTIPNSGKGFALAYGLERTSCEIIFRTDADSVIDKNALAPMMAHFKDPQVGAVCGWVFPLEGKGVWLNAQRLQCANALYIRRAQETFDSLLIAPGSSTAFRRETLRKTGGWVENIFGEDGEIGNRVARYGYKVAFEPDAIIYSEFPESLMGLMQQRARWGVAFYHSRGRNWRLGRELWTPRSIVYLWDLITHGARFGRNMIWPYLAALLITGAIGLVPSDITTFANFSGALWLLTLKFASVHILLASLQLVMFAYQLRKVKKLSVLKYYPFMRITNMIITLIVRPVVMDALLNWSVKWTSYSTQSFKALRKVVKRIDPLYPDREEQVMSVKSTESTAATTSTAGNNSAA